ncbi:MAG TPA: polysaccharide biosynthesis C-terminal domain-containing protein [Acidobacteriaceae bacterium]|nr:polysaccharide biosynthesis C-terminal domain-containing protein [Acidobacteriaceae bacterium]
MSNTKIIAKNTGWYGLENVISALVTLFTSIAIARTLGPSKMGYIIYVAWISSVVTSLGSLGIPSTTQKYMAEFIGMGDRGTARHIYFQTLWLQVGLATLATIGIIIWVLGDAASGYKLASLLIVLSILPAMINSIPAQANVATEDLAYNLPASIISILVFFAAILATVVFNWGVIGVGASVFLTRFVDCVVRIVPTTARIRKWPTAHVHPEGLRERMITFAWQSVASMIVAMIVWDRSEFILLKHLCSDIREIAYYSVAFSIAERLLITSTVFGSATGATIFAQYGRDKTRLPAITAASFRYLALSSIPVHFIAASLAFPLLMVFYGKQYVGAAMVVTIAPLLCMPKAFIGPVQNLLQSSERQKYVIWATVLAGIVDMSVAWVLIPGHGAVGACLGSGAAQVTAVGIMWVIAIRMYHIKMPWLQTAKITLTSIAASAVAHFASVPFAPLWGVLIGGTAALTTLLVLFYLLRVLEPEDQARLAVLTGMLPRRIAAPVEKVIAVLMRTQLASPTPSNV